MNDYAVAAGNLLTYPIRSLLRLPRTRIQCAVWRLSEWSRPQLRQHFCSLSDDDLYLRFGDHRSPQLLDSYVAGIDFCRSTVLGVFDERLELAGVAQLSPHPEGYELGLSVLSGSRSLGIGTLLLRRALRCARLTGAQRLHIHCSAENGGIIRLAKRFDAHFVLSGGEADGIIELAPATLWLAWDEVVEAQRALLVTAISASKLLLPGTAAA